jgi:hypothetical protein
MSRHRLSPQLGFDFPAMLAPPSKRERPDKHRFDMIALGFSFNADGSPKE